MFNLLKNLTYKKLKIKKNILPLSPKKNEMAYRLEELNEDDFEKLVIRICQKILGIGVKSFTKGKDGGKDGRFEGKADHYPSNSSPWEGKFIIQAKHTTNPTASCNDSEFRNLAKKEIVKIQKLKENNDIDCYLLFTNRKYSGVSGDRLPEGIRQQTGVDYVDILGKETIQSYLSNHKDIAREFSLEMPIAPFNFSEEDIKEVILAFKEQYPIIKEKIDEIKYNFDRIPIEEKNKKNKLGEKYYNDSLKESLEYFTTISTFLEDPINDEIKDAFLGTAALLKDLIITDRDKYGAFEEIFNEIHTKIYNSGRFSGKQYIKIFLHFMYYECLIGEK